MSYKVNGSVVKTDGDWMECPDCDFHETPLLFWMRYCPCCGEEVVFQETASIAEEAS